MDQRRQARGVRRLLARSHQLKRGTKSMKAVVMAGGEGSRLRPLTSGIPKPLVPVVGKPVLEHILRLLRKHGITDVVVTLQYLGSAIHDSLAEVRACGPSLPHRGKQPAPAAAGSGRKTKRTSRDHCIATGAVPESNT